VQGVKSVHLTSLRGSEGCVVTLARTSLCTFALCGTLTFGRGSWKRDGSRDEGNIRIGKRGNRIITKPRFDSSMRGVMRGMLFGKGASHIPLQ
jgi:hypothetical protein